MNTKTMDDIVRDCARALAYVKHYDARAAFAIGYLAAGASEAAMKELRAALWEKDKPR